jgi:hypothetical protein
VRAALASRVTRVRRAALRVLRRWPGTYHGWVAAAAAAEPDAKLRADMDTYLGSAAAGDEGTALCGAGLGPPQGRRRTIWHAGKGSRRRPAVALPRCLNRRPPETT